jgi:hypothetical protein
MSADAEEDGRRDRFPDQGTAKYPLLSDPCLVLQAFLCRPTGISKSCSRSWFAQFPIVPINLPYFSPSALNEPPAARQT